MTAPAIARGARSRAAPVPASTAGVERNRERRARQARALEQVASRNAFCFVSHAAKLKSNAATIKHGLHGFHGLVSRAHQTAASRIAGRRPATEERDGANSKDVWIVVGLSNSPRLALRGGLRPLRLARICVIGVNRVAPFEIATRSDSIYAHEDEVSCFLPFFLSPV